LRGEMSAPGRSELKFYPVKFCLWVKGPDLKSCKIVSMAHRYRRPIYIAAIIHSTIRVKFTTFHIPHKWDGTHDKWHTSSWNFGSVTARDSNI
jgi:hypothetical protein